MMIHDFVKVRGEVTIVLTGPDGEIKDQCKNTVVNTGKAFLASAINNASASPMTYMAIGSGTDVASITDTALISEVYRATFDTTTLTAGTATMTKAFIPGVGTGNITEAGLLNAATAGTMLSRTVFTVKPKGTLDTLTITWAVTVG